MSDELELRISGISELEALELQNEIEEHTKTAPALELSSEPLPYASSAGDPGLLQALLPYAPQVVPTLAAALAIWIAAGRKKKASEARTIMITRKGIVYANVKVSDLEREGAGKPLESVLAKLLKGSADDDVNESPVK